MSLTSPTFHLIYKDGTAMFCQITKKLLEHIIFELNNTTAPSLTKENSESWGLLFSSNHTLQYTRPSNS